MKKKEQFNQALFESQRNATIKALNYYFNDESKCIDWLYTKNPLLGNIVPMNMLRIGRFDKLITFIYTQLEENK